MTKRSSEHPATDNTHAKQEATIADDTNTSRRDASLRLYTPVSTGFPFWDMMFSVGRTSRGSRGVESFRVAEEVVLRREVTRRHETVRDTVRATRWSSSKPSALFPIPHFDAGTAQDCNGAAFLQLNRSEPVQLAADLKKAAELFEADGG